MADYLIETDVAHTLYFPFDTQPSAYILSSLKKLELGRIDGFIFADDATDPGLCRDKAKIRTFAL